MKTTRAPLGVTRINSPESHAVGWMARIARGKQRRNEFFADKDCGGSRLAKIAAIKQVRAWRRELPAAQTSHRGVLTKRNTSGEVNLCKRVQTVRDNEYEFWTGTWMERGGRKRLKSFSCHKYTERGAKRLAQIARDLTTQDMGAILAEYRKRHGEIPSDWKPA